jgi:hypothetical protein
MGADCGQNVGELIAIVLPYKFSQLSRLGMESGEVRGDGENALPPAEPLEGAEQRCPEITV